MVTTTRNQNFTIIGALVTFLLGGGGTVIVWAGDQRWEKKGAIGDLAQQVEENSKAQAATMQSVDTLLVQVLGERIQDLEKIIETLSTQTIMTAAEKDLLRNARQEVADARQERQATLKRILERRSQ